VIVETLRREIAIGLIVAADGRLLLQLRDNKREVTGAGKWGFFGGHVEPGERPVEAFLREMDEELGWRPRHLERYTTVEIDRDGWHVTSHAFAAHLDVPLDALTLGEGQAMALFTADALPPETTPSVRPVIAGFAASDAYRRVRKRWDAVTATALIVDSAGRFLLQHRDDKPDIYNPGLWGSFGGTIEPYETPHDGLLRELQEELSWQPESIELYGAYPYDGGKLLIYVSIVPIAVPIEQLVLGEGQGMAFFAPDALPQNTVPDLRALIERFARSGRYHDIAVGA
jgi:8-oxo-dGTP pyrophosphatase MutT (NUDIX family)